MGLQLRGLPKAYSTVYVDGVKKSDASTPKNDFYFDDILTGQVQRVEFFKRKPKLYLWKWCHGGDNKYLFKKRLR